MLVENLEEVLFLVVLQEEVPPVDHPVGVPFLVVILQEVRLVSRIRSLLSKSFRLYKKV